MTGKELRTFLIAWVKQIVVTEGEEVGFTVISSHRNAPSPDTAYIVVSYNANRTAQGRASRGDVQDDGTTLLVSDWIGTVEIREVYGDGDRLLELVKSLDRTEILDTYFRANGLAYYTVGEILPVPSLTDEHWNKESIVEITLGLAEGTRDTTSNIDTVEYNGNIGGQE